MEGKIGSRSWLLHLMWRAMEHWRRVLHHVQSLHLGGGQLLERGCLLLWGRLLLRELVLLGGIVVWGQEGDHLLGWRVRKEVLWGSGWDGGCIPRGMTWLPDRGREEGGYSSSSDLRPGGWAGSPSRLCRRGCSDVGGNLGGLGGQGRRGGG